MDLQPVSQLVKLKLPQLKNIKWLIKKIIKKKIIIINFLNNCKTI